MTSLTDTIAAAESIADSVQKGGFVGGVKQSGPGRESGRAGMDEYPEVEYMSVRAPW
ncbi:hypothetical protein ABT352_16810 [Streptosporangium sp. NPDC000563]|uniref:hypothetical protein n=1 Tax=unclassified Streptosporangium TaxID=2632669 RepID=UPI00331DE644